MDLLAELRGRSTGTAVLVYGPFGAGKTHLISMLEPPLLVGAASPDGSEAFEAFRAALAGAGEELQRTFLRTAGAGGPFFHPLAPQLFPPPRLEPPEAWLEAASHWLCQVAREHPGLVLALDDAQWLDEPSRLLVQCLVPRLASAPLMLLLASESDEPALTQLQRLPLKPELSPLLARELQFESEGMDLESLVTRRLARMDEQGLEALRDAALLGTYFPIESALEPALQARLVEQVRPGLFRLIHPRVRDVLLANLDPEDLRQRHERLGAPGRGTLFTRARHVRAAEQTGTNVHQTCRAAGLQALEQGGPETAREFLLAARKAAPEASDATLLRALGQSCAATGRLEEARQAFRAALEAESDLPTRTRLALRLAQLGLPESDRAELLIRALRENALDPPTGTWPGILRSALRWLGPRKPESSSLRVEVMGLAALWAASEVTPGPLLEAGLEAWRLSRQLGLSREKVRLSCDLMLLSGLLGFERLARHFHAVASREASQLADPPTLARTQVMSAITSHFLGHPLEAELELSKHLTEQGHWLSTRDFLFACNDLCWNLMLRGQTRQALQFVERARERVRPSPGSQADLDTLSTYVVSLSSTLGRVREALETLTSIQERFKNAPPLLQASLYGHAVRYYLEQDELGAPLEELLGRFAALQLPPAWVPVHRRYFYISQAQARLAQCEAIESGPTPESLERLKAALDELRRAARPPILRAHLLVLLASWSRLNGHLERALRQLEKAERLADRLDAPEINFWAARERALINRLQSNHAASLRYAELAHWLAGLQGWTNRARRIRREFSLGALVARETQASTTASLATERSRAERLQQAMRQFREVHQMATTDSLTGIPNRRFFFEQAEEVWADPARPVAAILLDVDHFKRINDTYGHAEGDQVLKAVAATCAGCLRQGDLLGRYGGEEFAILLSDVREEEARASAERVRAALEAAAVGTLRVTASLGVACRRDEGELSELLRRADEALYRAKAAGRNRVELAD